jgi:3-hydroxybutyryl-CoA dehydrogenase
MGLQQRSIDAKPNLCLQQREIMSPFQKVCFIGAGTQGCQNSLRAIAAGFDTCVYDISQDALDLMKTRQQALVAQFMEAYEFEPAALVHGIDNIRRTTDLEEALDAVNLVNESLPERMDLKLEFYAELESRVAEQTLLTTNTSSLPITPISKILQHPERFAALHFNGVSLLADVMPAPKTATETLGQLEEFARAIKLIPITLQKDVPGYLSNNILISKLQEAALLVLDGCASVEDVDRSVAMVQSNIGPFAMMDMIGLDVCRDVLWEKAERTEDQSASRASAFLAGYVEKGKLGAKSGKGFYTYPNAPWQQGQAFLEGL